MIGFLNHRAPTAASGGLALRARSRSLLGLALVLALALMAPAAAQAGQLLSYTLNGGNITGTLNGVAFSNASYTLTAVADTANLTTGVYGGIFPYYFIPATTVTITVGGLTPVDFTTLVWGPISIDYSAILGAGAGGIGFYDSGFTTSGFGMIAASGGLYNNLSSPGSFTGLSGTPANAIYSTTGGDLIITDATNNQPSTFTIAPVPEPATLVSAGLGGGLALGLARRRARAAAARA